MVRDDEVSFFSIREVYVCKENETVQDAMNRLWPGGNKKAVPLNLEIIEQRPREEKKPAISQSAGVTLGEKLQRAVF